MPEPVVIGLGTNLGDRLASLRLAVARLRALPDLRIDAVSPIYESQAMVPEGAPPDWARPYLNLAVLADWPGTPETLLRALKQIEADLGRKPRERWAPRVIDLDLLAFDRLALRNSTLTVPQAGLAERPFALLPFADVAPGWGFPAVDSLAGRTAAELAARWGGTADHVPFRTHRTGLSLTEVVGIVNLTPDSFSDGGRLTDPATAVEHARRLVGEGATVLDLGAESTRPGAVPVDPAEEWRRLDPVLRALVDDATFVVSVDTRHPATARRALDSGAHWINDVGGLTDPEMVSLVAAGRCQAVVMHSLGVPPGRGRVLATDRDPVEALLDWGRETLDRLEIAGLDPGRIILDPGIGFGKTAEQSTAILRRAGRLLELGVRVLVGHSRKSFLATWMPAEHPAAADPAERDLKSAWLAGHLAGQGVSYTRVHDVAGAGRAIRSNALVGSVVSRLDRPPPRA